MGEIPTQPIELVGPVEDAKSWQHDLVHWSFGQRRIYINSDLHQDEGAIGSAKMANTAAGSTSGPQELPTPRNPFVRIDAPSYGKRGLEALYEWEGVIERIENRQIFCRMVPSGARSEDRGVVEVTSFELDDLASESDHELVAPGAVIYWTVGKARNPAGTIQNVSLVRLRRLPAPSRRLMENARAEAERILLSLDGS